MKMGVFGRCRGDSVYYMPDGNCILAVAVRWVYACNWVREACNSGSSIETDAGREENKFLEKVF